VCHTLSYLGTRVSGENLFLLDPVVKPRDDNTIWHSAQDLNPDLSVLEADALTIKPATHNYVGGRCRDRTCATRRLYELVIRCLATRPTCLLVDAVRIALTCSKEGRVTATWAHCTAQHVRFTLVRRPGLEPGSFGLKGRCSIAIELATHDWLERLDSNQHAAH
jgi:hypothetical protein